MIGLESCRTLWCCPVLGCWLELECFLELGCCSGLASLGVLAAFASALGAVGKGFRGDFGEIDPCGVVEEALGSTWYRPCAGLGA